MRLIKMLGLAAIAALAAMAFLGASTASAEKPTVLCLKHTSLVCPEGQEYQNTLLHAVLDPTGPYGNSGILLNKTADVLCLEVLANPLALKLANPLVLHTDGTTHKITYGACGTNAEHKNCEIEETEGALLLLLKTGLDHGTLKADGGKTHVHCKNVTIFNILIDCTYDATGLEFLVGAQHLHASETAVNIVEGSFFCPAESKLDGLLKTLPVTLEDKTEHNLYILE